MLAGVNARHRLVQALAHADVVGLVPKIGAWAESAAVESKLEGPDEQRSAWRCAAASSAPPSPPAPRPICCPAAPSRSASSAAPPTRTTRSPQLLADAARFGLSDEKLRRIETAADELMLNAVYGGPRDDA